MLSAIILALSVLQLLIAIAVLGLSISIARKPTYDTVSRLSYARWKPWYFNTTLRYFIFLGVYGIISAIVNIISMFFTAVSSLITLVMNIMGAMLFLAGGIVWAVSTKRWRLSCTDVTLALESSGFSGPFAEKTGTSCRRCIVDGALVYALFALSVGLAVCSFLHHRNLTHSARF
ncbi:hypothetical protein VMCG_02474 [Cytospora schulzeri]|uniref:MARVEL domain-containing protein n=1 Tax=Cytospora schulzeri TaxID=448051 RepID=A0A423X1T6_9PEZI|nr:hypothetical protein VMCG_02474 [Valsa malicola]